MLLPAAGEGEPVSERLAAFAIDRHRVGPLLHMACQGADMATNEGVLSLLNSSYQENVYATLRQGAVEKRLADLLIAESVPFWFLKGRGLAEQLYRNPATRQSKDVDILVSTDRSSEVIELLNDNGYIYKSHGPKSKKMLELARQGMDIKLFKDLTFRDPDLPVPIELHGRLFKFEPNGLTSDFRKAVKSTTIPSLTNSFYCLYLILHGTLAMWPRLKWLVDLSVMARKMPVQVRQEMMVLAEAYGCGTAVAASILFAEELFPGSLDADWQALLEPFQREAQLPRMKGLYYECLTAKTIIRPSYPLKASLLSGAADLVFPGKIGLFETLFKRLAGSLAARI